MDTDRDSIREDIRKRLVKIKGIGPEKAERGSDAVMEYLDGLVQNQAGSSPKPRERDEDGIECIKRPDDVGGEYNYLYWEYSSDCTMGWTHPHKPLEFNLSFNHYTCEGLDDSQESYIPSYRLYEILGNTRVECGPATDRIVRLVD